jgi:hypothetical protein
VLAPSADDAVGAGSASGESPAGTGLPVGTALPVAAVLPDDTELPVAAVLPDDTELPVAGVLPAGTGLPVAASTEFSGGTWLEVGTGFPVAAGLPGAAKLPDGIAAIADAVVSSVTCVLPKCRIGPPPAVPGLSRQLTVTIRVHQTPARSYLRLHAVRLRSALLLAWRPD